MQMANKGVNLEIGKNYLVTCQRSGTYGFKPERDSGDFLYGVITQGKTTAMLDYNIKTVGDEAGLRKSFILKAIEILGSKNEQ
jgi:transposase-like protein